MSDTTEGVIIPLNERDPVLEEKVRYYLDLVHKLPRNARKPQRTEIPDTDNSYELEAYQREEIRRIKEGHSHLSPKMYFFYNYVKMWDVESGLIRPTFRWCQQEWFRQIEEAQNSKKYGLICVKRRRIGASWLEAADVLHDCITTPLFKVGMTSKTEEDAVELFKKVKFIYDELPAYMRPTSSAGNSRTSMFFGWREKDSMGNRITKGKRSEVLVKAPTETSWEGTGIRKWIADEGGKIKNLKAMFSMSNEIMRVGTRRVGCPIIMGTSGDITKEGRDLKEMWYNHDKYDLNQFFFAGYMGLNGLTDEFGNDMEEDAIRWIVYERFRREGLSTKEYNDFIQQYPLTVHEAFTSNDGQGLGNLVKINSQINELDKNPAKEKKGYFLQDTSGNVKFIPDNRGSCIIYEDPSPGIENLYLSGADPVDHTVEDTKDLSSLSMFIMKRAQGASPPKIVFKYTDRPKVPSDYYEQSILALKYYNNCRILIERNRPGMINYFEQIGYKHLLMTEPTAYKTVFHGVWVPRIGINMTKTTKKTLEDCVVEYIQDYCEYIPSKSLLKECQKYGVDNTDEVMSFGITLMALTNDQTKLRQLSEVNKKIPNWSYVRTPNGGVKRVSK